MCRHPDFVGLRRSIQIATIPHTVGPALIDSPARGKVCRSSAQVHSIIAPAPTAGMSVVVQAFAAFASFSAGFCAFLAAHAVTDRVGPDRTGSESGAELDDAFDHRQNALPVRLHFQIEFRLFDGRWPRGFDSKAFGPSPAVLAHTSP